MNAVFRFCLCCFFCLLAMTVYCGVYDVTDYYQGGDTSYAEAIARAIAAADANDGGVIYFPPGTYQVHQAIYVKKNLSFEGNSGPGGSSIIQATGESAFNLFNCFNSNASNVVFRNLVIDLNNLSGGGDTVGIGIYLHSDTSFNGAAAVEGVRIKSCEIKNGSSHGIRGFHTSEDFSVPFEVRIEDCKIHDCARQGIIVQRGTGVVISGTEIYDCGECGINFQLGKNYVVDSCTVYENDNHGIVLCYATGWKVVNNTVNNNGAWGITAGGGASYYPYNTYFVISKNIALENAYGGITVDPTISGQPNTLCPSYGVVSKNISSSAGLYHGVYINHASSMIVAANVCHENTNSGVLVFGEDCIIGNNIFSGVDPNESNAGITLANTAASEANHLLDHNMIYGTDDGLVISGYLSDVFSSLTEDLTQ